LCSNIANISHDKPSYNQKHDEDDIDKKAVFI
jgi:hypothetical protein